MALASSAEEPVHITSGACVTRSLIQWGSHVATMAIVDSSVLTEHSHVERHGIVTASILGPNTGVAEGEARAELGVAGLERVEQRHRLAEREDARPAHPGA